MIEHATRCLDLHHDRDDYDGNHQTMTLTYSYIRMVAQVEFEKNKELSATIKQLQSQTQKLKKDAKVDEVKQAGSAVVEKTKAGVCRSLIIQSIAIRSNVLDRELRLIETRSFMCLSRVVGDGRHRDLEHRVQGSRDGQEGHRDHCQ